MLRRVQARHDNSKTIKYSLEDSIESNVTFSGEIKTSDYPVSSYTYAALNLPAISGTRYSWKEAWI
jgi:hypothetical protein